ncbi:EVE domain-containing protein [Teredinibacter turnerae]|uniref:EVE domain-containing protein n=1 Tax=Teredinibacter turnerae TaxID=2426 RepID=UPI00042101F6|nr:EVE domain-containing protein [Teredinibacter turnerae]
MSYWLFKSEPNEYGIDHLAEDKKARWDGIRNYQARNILRDDVSVGDQVLFYHSSCKPTAIVGLAQVVAEAYPDPAQFNADSPYFDAKSRIDAPRWVCVDIAFQAKFKYPLTLAALKKLPELSDMVLLQQSRLSIQPVTKAEFEFILRKGNGKN